MVITVECWYQIPWCLPWYFNLRKSRYCSKLPWYFYNTGQKYHGILTLEKEGTTVNYRSIFTTLAPIINPSFDYLMEPYLRPCGNIHKISYDNLAIILKPGAPYLN